MEFTRADDAIAATRALPGPTMARLESSWRASVNTEDRALAAEEIVALTNACRATAVMVMATDRIDASCASAAVVAQGFSVDRPWAGCSTPPGCLDRTAHRVGVVDHAFGP